MPFRCFVALGDSLTEGVGDPVRGGRLRGWADRLAEGLAALDDDFRYVKLAKRSLTTREVLDQQLPVALRHEPDLASVLVGMNDLIRPGFHLERYRTDLSHMVAELKAAGATVLTATFPDVTKLLPLPRVHAVALRRRLDAANDAVRAVARAHGAVLVDARDAADAVVRTNFSLDRLHPSARGHLLIARLFAEQLAAGRDVRIVLPEPDDPRLLRVDSLRHARWLVAEGALRELPVALIRLWRSAGDNARAG